MKLPPRALFAIGAVIPIALVVAAVVLTVFYHIAACPLCIVQRMLYLAVALFSLCGLVFASNAAIRTATALLVAAATAGGTAIAGYQIYLQRNPFTATCGDGSAWWERMVDHAGQALPILFKADGLCSDNAWSPFGLSIVEWSLLAFVGLFVLGLLVLFTRSNR